MDWHDGAFSATVVLVAASLVLAVPGFAGVGVSVPLLGAFLVLAGALFAVRDRLAAAPTAVGHDLGAHGAVLWIGPLVATAVCLFFLDATAAELQALGGLVGLVGMVNYFLRPAYRAGYAVVRRVAGGF